MSTIVLRSVKGTPLTNAEVDANFTNLNNDKIEIGGTYSSGTANGVLYLSASKVLTTGSALTFDGSKLGVGTSSPAKQLDLAASNTGITTGDPLNTLRFTDTDTTSAAGQPMGRIEWYSADADTAGVKAYIQAQATDGTPDADIIFATNHVSGGGTAERMRIQYDGSVGIGTSSPGSRLEVLSASSASAIRVTAGVASTTTGTATLRLQSFNSGSGVVGSAEISNTAPAGGQSILTFSTSPSGNSPTERLIIYSDGSINAGASQSSSYNLRVGRNITGATSGGNFYASGTVQSDVTSNGYGFLAENKTAAATFTLGAFSGFRASQGTFGAGSTVTNQYGFFADSTLTGATNNYGFYSNIAAGTGDWNFYANGTADNYFAGNVLVGDTTSTTSPLSAGSFITASSTTGSELILKNSSGIVTGELVGGVAFGNDDPTSGTPPHYSGIQARSIDSSGTMTLGFYTGLANYEANTPQVLIDASGNMGIGTSSPLALLNTYQVNGGGDANILFQNFSTTTSTAVALYLSPTNGSLTTGSIRSAFIKGINVGGGVTALTFGTNSSGADPTEKMRLDSSGNLGLGVTPSGWASNYRALDFNHGALSQGGTGAGSVIDLNYNCYFNGTNWIYKNSDEASQYRQAGGLHHWYNAPSGTAGNTITFTQAMTLDASGNLGIGSTSLTGRRLVLSGTVTGSTTSYGMYGAVTFQSDVTTHAYGIRSQSGTQAASFTLPLLSHYAASQGTFGAASTVTTQYGFNADSSLTGATNNYGFYGNIAAATGRYNFYANGTADNYFAGNVLQGYTAPLSFTGPAGTITPTIQAVAPTGSLTQGIASTTHVTSGNGPNFVFGKSRGASASAPTIVSSGDASGSIVFTAYDGAAYLPTAYIQSAVDGTPGTNDMPGRLVFFTTADGASSPTERMRITNAGNVGIGTSSPNTNLEISTSVDPILRLNNSTNAVTTGADIGEIQFYTNDASINGTGIKSFIKTVAAAFGAAQGGADLVFGTAAYGVGDASEKMRLDKDGNMGLGVTPSAWGTSFKAMQLGAGGYISGRTNTDEVYVGANAYYDTTDNRWEYIATDVATQYYQDAGTHVWRYAGSGTAGAAITFTQAMTLDTSGRLLVGLTSSNAAFNGKLQVEGTTDAYSSLVRYSSTAAGGPVHYFGRSKSATLGTNTIVASGDTLGSIAFSGANGTGYSDAAYIQAFVDGTPGASADMPGRLVFSTSADGSATPTERMRIDSSGNVGIGNTAPASVLDIQRSTATTNATDGIFIMRTGCSGTAAAGLGSYINFLTENSNGTQYETAYIGAATESSTAADKDGYIFFSTALNSSNPTERMRINSSGDLLVNATSAVSGEKLFVTTNAAQNIIGARLGASGSNATCFLAGNATGATSFDYFGAYNGSGTKMAGITSAGTFQSATNTYGGTSDERLKENITDATPKLNDLLSVRIRNFNFKSDEQKLKQIGVIAQELETVFPALVEDTPTWNEQGESTGTVKNVKYSVFVPMLIKAMQEQQAIITALTARVAALESN